MNRDLVANSPESQARIKTFRKWMPNVLCGFSRTRWRTYQNQSADSLNQKLTTYSLTMPKPWINCVLLIEENYDFYYGKILIQT
jgi:hypothetical protein